jgi:competence protein ComEC
MDSPKLLILDVAHGNCTVIAERERVFVIDCAPGATLVDTLNALQINEIPFVLLSHADEDHIGGVLTLLLSKVVGTIYLNPDAVKKTEIWQDLRIALAAARRTGRTRVHTSLTTTESADFEGGSVSLRVVAPYPEDALGGVGGSSIDGARQYHNTLSAVIRILHNSHPIALLTGDMDTQGLKRIKEEADDLKADILVFPHHGGLPKGDGESFTSELIEAVSPVMVVFSIGRNLRGFPRPEVVRAVKIAAPSRHISCTQLSKDCASTLAESTNHFAEFPSRGTNTNSCCGGSIVIALNGKDTEYLPFIERHSKFIDSNVPTPLCRLINIGATKSV